MQRAFEVEQHCKRLKGDVKQAEADAKEAQKKAHLLQNDVFTAEKEVTKQLKKLDKLHKKLEQAAQDKEALAKTYEEAQARGRVRVGEEGYHSASLGPPPPPMAASQAFPKCRYTSLPAAPISPCRNITNANPPFC